MLAAARHDSVGRRRVRYGSYIMAGASVVMCVAGLVQFMLLGGLALVADCGLPCAENCPLPANFNHRAVGCICVIFFWLMHDGAYSVFILPQMEDDAYHGVGEAAAAEGDDDEEGSSFDDEESSGR